MIIAVAGPYSAPTPEERVRNLAALNRAAAQLLAAGHTPVIGVNAALPVLEYALPGTDHYRAAMDISMAVIRVCEALLFLGESPGAAREREYFFAHRLPVYYALEEVPPVL